MELTFSARIVGLWLYTISRHQEEIGTKLARIEIQTNTGEGATLEIAIPKTFDAELGKRLTVKILED